MKFIALTLVLFVLSSFKMGDSSIVEWQQNRNLTWDDYKAIPSENKGLSASTATEIRFDPVVKSNGKIYFLVRAMFHSNSSYVQDATKEGYYSLYTLNHEQKHFNITEIYCRILRKKLKSLQGCTDPEKYSLAVFLYHNTAKAWGEYQDKYDDETTHSQNVVMQKSWDYRIDSQLVKLKDWELTPDNEIYKLKVQMN